MNTTALPLLPSLSTLAALAKALYSDRLSLAEMHAYVPGSLPIRLSVVMGNLRMQRMLERLLRKGDTVVDVGANIGYNTLYAARCVGPTGRVYAIEPAQDNLAVLYQNLFANRLRNVVVLPYAASSTHEIKQFFLRGDVSAVNSMFQDNFYHPVTSTVEVYAAPLDELVQITPHLVKIDVEGGELEVLQGMSRILASPRLNLIVEWHATLQQTAGHDADALPRRLLELGFHLSVVTHTRTFPLVREEIPQLVARLLQKRSPVELLALRG
jgi:FkbM family methyltransferase